MVSRNICWAWAFSLSFLGWLIAPGSTQRLTAQTPGFPPEFVRLGPGVPGELYRPAAAGPKSQIAIFVEHSGGDYLAHSACTEMSSRGYTVLCANNSTSKSLAADDGDLNRILLDAKLGVSWLRKQPNIRKIVLLGHSGGGTLMSAYQDIAENGVKACQGPEKLMKCPDTLAGLPPADGLMLIDSNWGLAEMTLFSLDPAVVNDQSSHNLDPSLDLFNPANGFNPSGSDYSAAFIHRFQKAVGKRNNRLLAEAQAQLRVIETGKGEFDDDEAFTIAGANFRGENNRLFAQDTKLMAHTRAAWPLLKADGSAVTGIVPSVRVPQNTASTVRSFEKGALKTTVRNYLTTYAIRVSPDFGYDADSVHGIDWTSTYSSPPGDVEGVTVPLLTMGMTGHWEYLAAETIYGHAKSKDKTLVFVEGATHVYTTCKPCEKTPGEFGNTQTTTYNYVDKWLTAPGRFF